MVNPAFSGIFSGFEIEILEGDSTIVLEKAVFQGNVEIFPGELTVTEKAGNYFKWERT